MRAAGLCVAALAACATAPAGPGPVPQPPAAPPGAAVPAQPPPPPLVTDRSPAGRARSIVDAQSRSPPLTADATDELAPVLADLASGDDRRLDGALAIADEIAALIERARVGPGLDDLSLGMDGLDPIINDLEPALDQLRRTARCAMIGRVEQVADRFQRLPRRRAAQAQPGRPVDPDSRPISKRSLVCTMSSIKGQVADCFVRYQIPGMAMVNVVVTRQGTVSSATTAGKFAGTPTGDCVAAAVKTLTFPPSDGISFPYPFMLK